MTWNCDGEFYGEKIGFIKEYNADILVIPECRQIYIEKYGYDKNHRYWYGNHKKATNDLGNINKSMDRGIGIFWKENITIKPNFADKNGVEFRYILPFNVKDIVGHTFILLVF